MNAFPQLNTDVTCDVAVVGAGLTGALIADELVGHGHDVVVLGQRDVCWDRKSASTELLQHEIDIHAIDLTMRYAQATTLLAHQSCLSAISVIGAIVHAVGDVDFDKCESLYYASNRADHPHLADEFAWRKQHGFPDRRLNRAELEDERELTAPAAILSLVTAQVDAYRITSRLLRRMQRQGSRVFDRTQVKSITASPRSVRLININGISIRARYAVIAGGYETRCWLHQRVARNRSYANISDSVDSGELGRLACTLLWEFALQYLHLRSTSVGRLLVGSEHDDRDIPVRRGRLVDQKAAILRRKVSRLSPPLHAQPAFAWEGTFAETSDGLPLFGRHLQYGPRVLSAMTYGENIITYGMIGAGLLRAQLERHPHPLTAMSPFERPGCQ